MAIQSFGGIQAVQGEKTNSELADYLGVSHGLISNVKNGQGKWSPMLAKALGVKRPTKDGRKQHRRAWTGKSVEDAHDLDRCIAGSRHSSITSVVNNWRRNRKLVSLGVKKVEI